MLHVEGLAEASPKVFGLPQQNFVFPRTDQKSAFTLAEVLITLGIVGIIASLTLPAFLTNYQKSETISKLKESYSILNNIMKLSEIENGNSLNWPNTFNSDYYSTYWKPYIVNYKQCSSYSTCGYKQNDPWLGIGTKTTNTNVNVGFNIILGNGVFIHFGQGYIFFVDINGSKSPNKMGRDTFVFDIVHSRGQVLPHGYESVSEAGIDAWCSATENLNNYSSGVMCAEKIRRSGWVIKNDYPW